MKKQLRTAAFSFIAGVLIYPVIWTLIRDTMNMLLYLPANQTWQESLPSISSALKSLHYSFRFGTPLLPMTIGYSTLMTLLGQKRKVIGNQRIVVYSVFGAIVGSALAAVIVPIGSVMPFDTVLKLFCVPGAIAGFLVAVILQVIIWRRDNRVSPHKAP